jgi:hypothetical protein
MRSESTVLQMNMIKPAGYDEESGEAKLLVVFFVVVYYHHIHHYHQ